MEQYLKAMFPEHWRPKAEVYHNALRLSVKDVAAVLGVSKSTAGRWILSKGVKVPRRKHRPRRSLAAMAPLLEYCSLCTFDSCQKIRAAVRERHGLVLSLSTIYRSRKSIGLTFKRASRSHEHELPSAYHPFMHDDDPYEDAICVDEASFVSSDTPRYGWAQAGHAVRKPAPRKRATVSVILAIDRSGIVGVETLEGGYDAVKYARFLASLPRGRKIIADNVPFHSAWQAKHAAFLMDQTLEHTPAYCPWMNPVEHGFSVAKHEFRRRRYELPNEGFLAAVKASFATITADKCVGFFRGAEAKRREAISRLRAVGALEGVVAQRGGRSLFFMDI